MLRWNSHPGVANGKPCDAALGLQRDAHFRAAPAVADCVIHQIADQLTEPARVAADPRGVAPVAAEPNACICRAGLVQVENIGDGGVHLHVRLFQRKLPRLRAGQQQQILRDPGEAIELIQKAFDNALQLGGGALAAQGHLGLAAQGGERRAQLVRGVGEKLTLLRNVALDAVEHFVERGRQLVEFVVCVGVGQAIRQRPGADPTGGRGHGVNRLKDPAGESPRRPDRSERHQRQACQADAAKCRQRGRHPVQYVPGLCDVPPAVLGFEQPAAQTNRRRSIGQVNCLEQLLRRGPGGGSLGKIDRPLLSIDVAGDQDIPILVEQAEHQVGTGPVAQLAAQGGLRRRIVVGMLAEQGADLCDLAGQKAVDLAIQRPGQAHVEQHSHQQAAGQRDRRPQQGDAHADRGPSFTPHGARGAHSPLPVRCESMP